MVRILVRWALGFDADGAVPDGLGADGGELSEQNPAYHRALHPGRDHRCHGPQHRAKVNGVLGASRGGGQPPRRGRLAGPVGLGQNATRRLQPGVDHFQCHLRHSIRFPC